MKLRFQFTLFMLLGLLPVLAPAALQNGKIQTDVTVGDVYTLDDKANRVKIVPGQYYEQGSSFTTGADSTIQLVFSNGATLLLNPNTSVVVRTFKQVPVNLPAPGKYLEVDREPSPSVTEIILEKGKVVGEVRKLNSQSSYTIRTGVGVVKIKGTIFTVAYSEDVAKGAGNIDTSCVRGSVDLTLFGSNTGPVAVDAGKRITAQCPIVDENGVERSGLAVKTLAEARETKKVTVTSTQGLARGMVAQGDGIPPDAKIDLIDSETEITLSVPVVVISADTKLTFKKADGASSDSPIRPPEIIPVTISISKLDAKQIGDIATILSTGSSLPVAVINYVQQTAQSAPPPGSPETTLSPPTNPNNLPETTTTPTVTNPTVTNIIDSVVKNTQVVIEREQQTNPSPVQ